MVPEEPPDIALVSLGTTPGLRRADEALAGQIRELGAACSVVPVRIGISGRLRRAVPATDLVEAWAARGAAVPHGARAVIFSTVTAVLLARTPPVPWAVRFDSPAAINRGGPGGLWQRARERAVLPRADLLLPWGRRAGQAVIGLARAEAVVALHVPVTADAGDSGQVGHVGTAMRDRDGPPRESGPDAIAYAGYPRKRGLEVLAAAWGRARPPEGRLVIGGLSVEKGRAWLRRCGVEEPPGIEWAEHAPHADWARRVAGARVFVNASRWEDHGLAQLEALAAGVPLVTVPSPGAYEALPLARELAPALVADAVEPEALAGALRAGLALGEAARAEYASRARELLAPYRPEAVKKVLGEEVLPRLGVEP